MKKILVVDNHTVTLKYLESLLGKNGYEVRTAEDGIAALDIIREFKPDIFFVDLIMPYIRGEKLISILRNIDEVKDSKIVVLSGIAAEIESEHVRLGADACIAKTQFNKMGAYILELLDTFDKGGAEEPIEDVIGVEDVYKRAITTELVAGRRHTDVIMNNISDGILELNRDLRVVYANSTAMQFFKSKESEIISKHFKSLWDQENADAVENYINHIHRSGNSTSLVLKEGGVFYEINARYLITENDETFIIILKDITLFKKELIEKDAMIKEVNHRVKNNLTIISSIINLQIGDSKEENIRRVLHDLKNRIDSIALIHSKIFKSNDPDSLSIKEYLIELFSTLLYSEVDIKIPVNYKLDVPDIELGIDYAVPLGLIVTELVTNSLKYAFTGRPAGEITLSGRVGENDTLNLIYSDNGSASKEYFSFLESNLLSLQIIEALALQLGSEIVFKDENGASYFFSISLKAEKK